MGKRSPHHDDHPRIRSDRNSRKRNRSSSPSPSKPKTPSFPSYLQTPGLSPTVTLFCQLIAAASSSGEVQTAFDATNLRVSQPDVEQVLKHSYSFPSSALAFFRWAGLQINHRHSPYSWNLIVDLLGKNFMFDAMWGAIKSMKLKGLVSLATFASVFSSYVIADTLKGAIMAFDDMDQYGCPRNVVALNSLLSAICRDGKTFDAVEFFHVAKSKIQPDPDTYAILLEGWEKERNPAGARQIFHDMVSDIGWNPANIPAYDTFLCTLLFDRDGLYEAINSFETLTERRCYPGMKFLRTALKECLKCKDVRGAGMIWKKMVERMRIRPDTRLCNLMINLYGHANDTDTAKMFFDQMIYNGSFPDSETYNLLFRFMTKSRKLNEASAVFNEMVKNECVPSRENCDEAIRVFLNSKEPYMAIKVWKCMVENYESDLDDIGNLLVIELRYQRMVPEAVKYAEDMIEKGIKLTSSTLSKLKQSLTKERKEIMYEELLSKWKAHSIVRIH